MRMSVRKMIQSLATSRKITKFVAKIFFMTTISDFNNGDFVCLKHDITKRFVVENNLIFNGKVQLSYFNEIMGGMTPAFIEPKYLMLAPKQEQFCSFK